MAEDVDLRGTATVTNGSHWVRRLAACGKPGKQMLNRSQVYRCGERGRRGVELEGRL